MSTERVQLSHRELSAMMGPDWPSTEVSEAARLLRAGGGKFPSGTRSLSPGLIGAIQRERLLRAMLRASAELGYRDLTVQDVLDRAGISRPTFYESFGGKEDCFLAAFDAAASRLEERLRSATEGATGGWRERLRTGLAELLRYVATETDAAWTLIVEARTCTPALVRRDELLDRLATWIDAGARAELGDSVPASPLAAVGVIGGLETLLYNRLTRGETSDIQSLLPSLVYFVVLSYEGREAALGELPAIRALTGQEA